MQHKIAKYTFFIICAVLVLGQVAKVNADPLAQAKELRIDAAKDKCEAIHSRLTECWLNGNKDQCTKLHDESLPWFKNEFGALPEIVCPRAARGESFMNRS